MEMRGFKLCPSKGIIPAAPFKLELEKAKIKKTKIEIKKTKIKKTIKAMQQVAEGEIYGKFIQ